MVNTTPMEVFVSVVAVLDGREKRLDSFLREVGATLENNFSDFEIVLVTHSGAQETAKLIEPLLAELTGVRLIHLANAVSNDVAWAAAVENAIGDFVVFMSPETDPAEIIVPAVNQCRAGTDVIVGVDKAAGGPLYGALSGVFHTLVARWVRYEIPRGSTRFRVLSRRAVNAVTRTGRFRHVFFVRVSSTGYLSSTFPYSTAARSGQPARKSIRGGFRDAMNMVVFNTTAPLRLMSGMGIAGSLLSILYAVYSIAIRIWKQDVVEGWTSLSLVISGLFFLLFTMLFFFGEYLSRLLDEQSHQEDYDVAFEKCSALMVNEDRHNVRTDSTGDATAPSRAERHTIP